MAVKTWGERLKLAVFEAFRHRFWLRPQHSNIPLMQRMNDIGVFGTQIRAERDDAINLLITSGVLTQAQAEARYPNWASTL